MTGCSTLIASVVCLLSWSVGTHQNDRQTPSPAGGLAQGLRLVCGDWKVGRVVATSRIHGDRDVIQRQVGSHVTYSATRAQFGEAIVPRPSYRVRTMLRPDFAEAYRIQPDVDLGIADPRIAVVSVNDPRKGSDIWLGGLLIVKDSSELIATWSGVFVKLERQGPCK